MAANKILSATCAVLAIPAALYGGPWTWQRTAGGEYSFEDVANWGTAGTYGTYVITDKATEGPQTIVVGQLHDDINNFYVGGSPHPLLFKGAELSVGNYLAFKFGETIVENAIVWNAPTKTALVGDATNSTLRLRNGGSLAICNDVAFSVGTGGRSGTLIVEKGGTLGFPDGGTLKLGAAVAPGSSGCLLVKAGGAYSGAGNHRLMIAGQTDGSVRQDGGRVEIGTRGILFNTDDGTKAPAGDTYGLLHFAGGELLSAGPTKIGCNAGSSGLYVGADGMTLASVCLGGWTETSGTGRNAALTVGCNAVLTTTGDWTVGSANAGGGDAIDVNLNDGGTVRIAAGTKLEETDGAATVNFNFNGGRIESRGQVYMQPYERFRYVVYPKGGTLALRDGGVCNANGEIVDATGFGVDAIEIVNPGAGYASAPKVVISGGAGTGASAIAVMGEDQTVTGVVITCRGSGYLADDEPIVTFVSPAGGGASAVAKLSANTPGVFTIDCDDGKTVNQWQLNHYAGILNLAGGTWSQSGTQSGLPNLGELRISGGSFSGRSLNPAVTLKVCAGDSSHLSPAFKVPSGTSGITNGQEVAELDLSDGVLTLGMGVDNKGYAKFSVGRYVRDRGVGVVSPHARFLADIGETALASTGADGVRQLNGIVWDKSGTLSPTEIGEDGALNGGATKNVGSAAAEGESVISERKSVTLSAYSTVNSLTMNAADGLSEVLFGADGQSEILSGMVLFRYSGTNALKRIAATAGTITTRNPGGLVFFANGACERELVLGGQPNHLKVEGPFADPSGGNPLSLTFSGRRQLSPDRGALYWLNAEANTFSGGVNLNDGAVAVASDSSLGAAAAPIHVSGHSLLMSAGGALSLPATRTIEIADKARFVLRNASEDDPAARIAATVAGSGDLYANRFDSAMAMKLTGDLSGFDGNCYVSGTVETPGLPERVGIRFAGDAVPGILATSGRFVHCLSAKRGGIAWIGSECYGTDRAFGGLAAKGGNLAVDFGGAGETVRVGCAAMPDGSRLALQSADSDGELTVSNLVDLCGNRLSVAVAAGKEATLASGLADSAGGGELTLAGKGVLTVGGVLPTGLKAAGDGVLKLVGRVAFSIDGEFVPQSLDCPVEIGATLALETSATVKDLRPHAGKQDGFLLLTAAGGIGGVRSLPTSLGGWRLQVKGNELRLVHAVGTVLIVR